MKSKLAILFFIQTQILAAQTFTEMAGTPFEGVSRSSIAFSDVNGDGHNDVLITGSNSSSLPIAKLYTNDGAGTFTEKMGTPFDGVNLSSIAFSDVNGDGHNDVLITGVNSSSLPIAKLYTNDGAGTFTEKMGTPFDGVLGGSIAFSDVNGDGHDDVLITGQNSSLLKIAKLYTNDGTGNFTEKMDTPFVGVAGSAIAFSDVNGDGHNDVLITGQKASGERIAKLYTYDGVSNFTEMTGTPFQGVFLSSIAFSDINSYGHDDVLITGINEINARTKLYTNDGAGSFTEKTGTPLIDVIFGSIAFSDVNGDGHEDALIMGRSVEKDSTKLYTNDGTGNFTEVTGSPFDSGIYGSIAFSDVNGDGRNDVLLTGQKISSEPIAKLYINNGVSSTEDLTTGISLDFRVLPNPATASTLALSYDSPETGAVTIKVFDLNGRLLLQQKENAVNGQQTFSIDIATLPKGSYFVELDNSKSKGVAKFVVQ